VSLSGVANIDLTTTYPQITRQNGQAIARIVGKIDNDVTTATAISAVVKGELAEALQADFPGVSVGIGGAAEGQQETQRSIATSLLLGLVGVYLILAFQFRSYTLPIMVMITIPFALVGVIFGHLAMGMDISMPSFIGFASLAGVVVNNAILFLTFFEAEIRDDDYVAAAVEAVRQRFRPVLLSFSTTFIGLLPIVFETSPQAATIVPLVVSVAFGLLASTLLVIFVFPSVLAIYFDFKDVSKWLATRSNQRDARQGDARPDPASQTGII
jgi:HAE1 family hydrophobic/amphiphilic exporter-1